MNEKDVQGDMLRTVTPYHILIRVGRHSASTFQQLGGILAESRYSLPPNRTLAWALFVVMYRNLHTSKVCLVAQVL